MTHSTQHPSSPARLSRSPRRLFHAALLFALAASTPAWAGGNVKVTSVTAGAAAVAHAGNVTTITTASQRTIINYQQLTVAPGETLNFIQPNAASRVLNRINGSTPTNIDGTLLSNGQVYLVNPAGVMFGNGAVINVGGLYAAAGHLSDADFIAGNNSFTNNTGSVLNFGTINAGEVHLIGLNVGNFGEIVTAGANGGGGVVTMTAGTDVYIGESSSPTGQAGVLVKVSTDKSAVHDGTGVTNTGKIDTGGGQLHMGAGDVYAAGIYNSGTLKGKAITLDSTASTNVNTGTIDASNDNGNGGSVKLLGNKVGVFGGTVNASGSAGGGEVLVGGDLHGGGGVPVSDRTVVATGASIRADGTAAGANGGKVVVFSSTATEVGGTISTLNGAGGVGGFVETSSLNALAVNGAPAIGDGGTWLIDPRNITITTAGPTSGTTGSFTANADDAVIKVSDLQTALDSGNVIISTGGTGLQAGTVIWSAGADIAYNFAGNAVRTLTINAASTITINANVAKTGGGNDGLNFVLNSTGGDVVIGGNLDTNGATFSSTGAAFTLTGQITTGGGSATINHTGLVAINGTLDVTNTGDVAITAGAVSQTTSITANNLAVAATGNVNLSTANAVNNFAVVDSGASAGVTFVSTGNLNFGTAAAIPSSSTNNGLLVVQSGNTLTVNAAVATSGGGFTLIGDDFAVNANITAGAGTVLFQAKTVTDTFGLGAAAGQDITLTQTELGHIASAGAIQVGLAGGGGQTGNVTVKTLDLHTANAPFIINTTGTVALDDNNASPALATGNNITINAGVITAANATNAHSELASANSAAVVTLNSAAAIGTTTNRISIGKFNGTTDVGLTGSVAVTAAGNVFLDGIGGLTFSSISNSGNPVNITAAGNINATGAIAGSTVSLNASGGGIGTAADVPINASTSISVTTSGAASAGNINISIPAGALPTLTIATAAGAQTTTVDSTGALSLANNISAPAADTVVIHAGTSGTGNLSFSAPLTIATDNLELWAGKGDGSESGTPSKVDFSANAPTIHDSTGALKPASVIVRQDAAIADADLLPAAQFDHGLPTAYQLEADGSTLGTIAVATPANVNGTGLILVAGVSTTISTPLNVLSLSSNAPASTVTGDITSTSGGVAFLGNLTITGNITSHTLLAVTGTTLIKQNTSFSSTAGGDLNLAGLVSSESGKVWTLSTNFNGITSFGAGISTTPANLLGALDIAASGGTVNFGTGSGSLSIDTKEDTLTNGTADGHISIGEALTLKGNTTFSITTTQSISTLGSGVADVTLAAVDSQASQHFSLTVNSPGVTWFKGNLGSAANGQLGGVTTDAPGGLHELTKLGNNAGGFSITVSSPVTFGDAVLLLDNTSITAPGLSGNVSFNKTVDSESSLRWTLTVTAGGTTSFADNVGAAITGELGALTLNGTGTAQLGTAGFFAIVTREDTTANASATGVQSLDLPITILANTTFAAFNTDPIVSPQTDITLGLLSAGSPLGVAVNTGGVTWFKGGISAVSPLANLTTDAGGSTKFGTSGAISVITTGSEVFNDAVTLNGNTSFKSPILNFNGSPVSIDASTFDLSLQSDAMSFAGGADSVQGTGNIIIKPLLDTDAIVLGRLDLSPNTLSLDRPSLLTFKDGFASITIGSPTGSGPVTISSDDASIPPHGVEFTDPVTIQSPSGSIHLLSPDPSNAPGIYGAANASVTLHASAILLDASIMTNGNAITVQGAVTLGTASVIQIKSLGTDGATLSTNGPAGGPITIIGNINDDASPTLFIINAGFGATLANVDVQGNIGNTTPVGVFAEAAAEFRTHGSIFTSGGGQLQFSSTTVALAGNIDGTTVSTSIFDTDSSGGTANAGTFIITTAAPINLVPGTGPVNLTIDTTATGGFTSAPITLASVGNTTPLRNLTLTGAAVSVADLTLTGAFSSSGTTFANSGIISSVGATINHSAAVNINAAISSSTAAVSITGNGITTAAGATLSGVAITLASGAGATTLGATVTATGLFTDTGASFTNNFSVTSHGASITPAGAVNINAALASSTFAVTLSGTTITEAAGAPITGGVVQFTTSTGVDLSDTVTATGGFTSTGTGASTFFLEAGGSSNINTAGASVTISHPGALVAISGQITPGAGAVSITGSGYSQAGTVGGGVITIDGGVGIVTLSGTGQIAAGSTLHISGSNITNALSGFTVSGTAITFTSTSLVLFASPITGTGLFTSTGLDFTDSGAITAHGISITQTGLVTFAAALNSATFPVTISGTSIHFTTATTLSGSVVGLTSSAGVNINGTAISATGGFTSTGTGTSAFTLNAASSINTAGADVTISHPGALVTINGPIAAGAGNVSITGLGFTSNSTGTIGGGSITLAAGAGGASIGAAVTATSALSISGTGIATGAGATLGGTAITLTAGSGDITLGATVTGTGPFTATGANFTNNFAIAAHGVSITQTGAVNINADINSAGFAAVISGTTINLATGVTINASSLAFTDTLGLTIDSVINAPAGFTSTGPAFFTITTNGAINTTNSAITITHATGLVTLNGPIAAGTGAVTISGLGITTGTAGSMSGGIISLNGHAGAASINAAISGPSITITAVGITTGASAPLAATAITLTAGAGNVLLNGTVNGSAAVTVTGAAFTNNAAVTSLGINLNMTGLATLHGDLNASTGTAKITAAGVSQTAGIITADSLALSGTGNFTLPDANVLNTLAANITGPLSLTNSKALAVGTAASPTVTGVTTGGGALTLNLTAGDLTISSPVSAGAITFTAATVHTGSIAGTSTFIVNGNLAAANAIAIPGNITITGNAVLAAALTSSAGAILVNGNASSSDGNGFLVATTGSIHILGALTATGPTSAGTTLTVDGPVVISSGTTLNAGTAAIFNNNLALTGSVAAGTSLAVAGTTAVTGNLRAGTTATFGGTFTFSGTAHSGGAFSVAGNASLDGHITAPLITIPHAVALSGDLTLSDDTGITLGTLGGITGAHDLTLHSNNTSALISVGPMGSLAERVGNVTFESANLVELKGNIFANTIVFNDNLAGTRTVPASATIFADTATLAAHTLTIDTIGVFKMEQNQKFTVHDSSGALGAIGNLIIQTDGAEITIADISVLGKLTISVGTDFNTHITILNRDPVHNLLSTDLIDGQLDKGADIVAGFNGAGAIAFRGTVVVTGGDVTHRIQFASVDASNDISSKPGILGYVVGSNLAVVPVNIPSGSLLKESDFLSGSAVLDIVANGISGTSPTATQGTVIPRDVQTLQPERAQAISGALRDALRELGIYARDLRTDEVIEYLIGRALYDDVPYKLDPSPTDTTVAANRLPYSPVLPTVDAYRKLFFKQDVDDKGNPVVENGKPKLTPQDNVILTSFGQAWNQYVKDMGDNATPAGFRAYLEAHQKDDPKLAAALDYLDQLRDLLGMIKSLGLTTNEFDVSKKVLLSKVRPGNIKEEDFPDVVSGPTSLTNGQTAIKQ